MATLYIPQYQFAVYMRYLPELYNYIKYEDVNSTVSGDTFLVVSVIWLYNTFITCTKVIVGPLICNESFNSTFTQC